MNRSPVVGEGHDSLQEGGREREERRDELSSS
jgi:hypothetical protein